MKIISLLFISAILSGCANMSQSIQNSAGVGLTTVSESSFDGSKEVSMAPAWVAPTDGGMVIISIGLNWNSRAPNNVGMLIRLTGNQFQSIRTASLNLDGEIFDLEPREALTNLNNLKVTSQFQVRQSDKYFSITRKELEKLATAKSAKLKVGDGRTYVVGDFRLSSYGNITAGTKIPEFIQELPN